MSINIDPLFKLANDPSQTLRKIKKAKEKMGNRSGPYIKWLAECEDDSKLRMQKLDGSNGIPTVTAALNDLTRGLVCIAAQANAGKSSLLVNMMMGALRYNEDVIIYDISLDDHDEKRYQQYIACLSGLGYQQISTSSDLSETEKALREDAEEQLSNWISEGRLHLCEALDTIYDTEGNEVRTLSMRKATNIKKKMEAATALNPNKKIVFVIDAWNNIDLSGNSDNENTNANNILNLLKETSEKLGIIILLSAHLRKVNGRNPTIEDIKGTSDMAYHALAAILLRNEYRENPLKEPLMYDNNDVYCPMLVGEIRKNKVGTWDQPIMWGLLSESCGLLPVNRKMYYDSMKIYRSKQNKK